MKTMSVSPGCSHSGLALDVAERWAKSLSVLGAEVEWVRGQSYSRIETDERWRMATVVYRDGGELKQKDVRWLAGCPRPDLSAAQFKEL